jgi:hypothetical protein
MQAGDCPIWNVDPSLKSEGLKAGQRRAEFGERTKPSFAAGIVGTDESELMKMLRSFGSEVQRRHHKRTRRQSGT